MSKPKNWPSTHLYFTSPQHSPSITKSHLHPLRNPPLPSPPRLPPSSTPPTPSPHVKIQRILDPAHPAHAQHGLFAARDFRPGEFILAYLGEVHAGASSRHADSDYDLWIDREADVAVDAARGGNEARFVNDYRGVREGPNAEFGNFFAERWGEVCVGIWAVGGGAKQAQAGTKKKNKKKSSGGIKKGEEILVSYGKGFWEERRREDEEKEVKQDHDG